MPVNFSFYQDPGKAKRIWLSYKIDLNGLGGLRRAETLASECSTSGELEAKLDMLITELQSGKNVKYAGKSAPVDSDSDGSIGNSTRLLESD